MDILPSLTYQRPPILSQQNSQFVILVEKVVVNYVSPSFHKVFTPHHHTYYVCYAYQL